MINANVMSLPESAINSGEPRKRRVRIRRAWVPTLEQFGRLKVNFKFGVRLHSADPEALKDYQREKARVRSSLLDQVGKIRQFGRRQAALRLTVWDHWVWSGGKCQHAANRLTLDLGRPYTRHAVHYHISCMRQDG